MSPRSPKSYEKLSFPGKVVRLFANFFAETPVSIVLSSTATLMDVAFKRRGVDKCDMFD